MRVDPDLIQKYGDQDMDTTRFLEMFEELSGARVLEVGAREEDAANILAEAGYRVTGFDLRHYEGPHPCLYEHVQHDFCMLPPDFLKDRIGTYDSAFSTSAIEHFGLGGYGEGGPLLPYYDVVAMHVVWRLLKVEGTAYITVPYGSIFRPHYPNYRIYDKASFKDRIVQAFNVEKTEFFISYPMIVEGNEFKGGEILTEAEANSLPVEFPPHLTILAKLRKTNLILKST